MKKILNIVFGLIIMTTLSCGGGGDDSNSGFDNNNSDPVIPAPKASVLSKPANNSECLEVDAVNFEWNKSDNTDSYTINVKNLSTNAEISQTTTSTSVEITLEKSYPYSWHVISTNSGTATAKSATWKFFLSGTPMNNHAPFPADIVSPKPGAVVSKGNIELSWSVSDIDSSDTHTFTVYLDKNDASEIIAQNITSTKTTVNLSELGTYKWRVEASDNYGAKSNSGTSTFTVID